METSLFTNAAAQAANATSTSSAVTGSADKDMFTKLLVAQIKNQDPLSPQDPSQFVQQLTQLSQTEALQNLANLTSSNASVLQSMQVLALGAQVGSDVMTTTDTVQVGSSKINGEFTLDASSAKTSVVLTGSNGVETSIPMGTLAAGTVPFAIDPQALGLPEGSYNIKVVTSTGTGTVDVAGRLNSVRLGTAGSVVLNVANVGEVSPNAITAFNGKSSTATNSVL
ncbi:flagellar hook capping FlgD N-terminal domain-containing protein [Pseudoduganella sp. RAF53_2]|uniref:flagellar hook capping FlgD N-terminal domain-containing protein n=1 Tax=unclassified Pseudoduganella TaxID=2637179 RepID=UPI003F97F308